MLVPDFRKDIELAEEFNRYRKRAEDIQGTLKEITDELRLFQREKHVGKEKISLMELESRLLKLMDSHERTRRDLRELGYSLIVDDTGLEFQYCLVEAKKLVRMANGFCWSISEGVLDCLWMRSY